MNSITTVPHSSLGRTIHNWTMPPHKLAHILDQMVALGVSKKQLLAETRLSTQQLRNADAEVDYWQCTQLIRNALALSPVPALGFYTGLNESTSTFGVLGYAMSCAANLGEAAKLAMDYQASSPAITHLDIKMDDTAVYFDVLLPSPDNTVIEFAVEEAFAACLKAIYLLTGRWIYPLRAELSYAEPEHHEHYRQYLRCPIQFTQLHNRLVFAADIIDVPTQQGNILAKQHAVQLCQLKSAQQDKAPDAPPKLADEVTALLLENPDWSESQLADQLNISSRQLRRRLSNESTSFKQIIDDSRFKISQTLLKQHVTLNDIAAKLGYSDTCNFRRAFKRWSGMSPSEFKLKVL